MVKLKSSLRKFYGNAMKYPFHKWPPICCICRNHSTVLFPIITVYRVYDISYRTGVTSGGETAYTLISHCCLPAFCGYPFFSFLWNALYRFHLVIILSVMWIKASDYSLWIFKLKPEAAIKHWHCRNTDNIGSKTSQWQEKIIQHRTKKMSSTNPHLNAGVNPDVRQVSCSSLF